jgi:uncharacterized membrane protein YdjX (TVP38/TMEM64 family)
MQQAWLRRAKPLLPLLAILAVLALALAQGWHRHLSWAALAAAQADLLAHVAARPLTSAAAYVAAYAAAVAVSIPGAVVITVTGGLLFGTVLGTVLAVTGATIGAVLVFLAARSAAGPLLAARAAPLLGRIRPGLERDGFAYLLAARLIPVLPFWLLNLAPALVGMRLAPFALATFLGIIPGTAVFASIGAGLGHVLEAGQTPDLSLILAPQVLLPILALAALSLAPTLWRRWKSHA